MPLWDDRPAVESRLSSSRELSNVARCFVVVVSALEPFLDDVRVLPVGDLDLDPDHGCSSTSSAAHDLSGWAKALWFLFVLFIPLIGVLVYLIARGGSMHERAAQQAQRQDEEAPRPTSSKPRRAHRPAPRTSWPSWPTCATGESSQRRNSSARRPRSWPEREGGQQSAARHAGPARWRLINFTSACDMPDHREVGGPTLLSAVGPPGHRRLTRCRFTLGRFCSRRLPARLPQTGPDTGFVPGGQGVAG